MTPLSEPDIASGSQTERAQHRLRQLIIGGELKPGQRVAELGLVERIGVSRTPIRTALLKLQEEGLIDALPGGGFVVKDFTEDDIRDAIELRGTLEGLAARLAAERGVSSVLLAEARACAGRIDEVLLPAELSDEAFDRYVEANGRLHELLAVMAGSELVERQLLRVRTVPFASPNGLVFASSLLTHRRDSLVVSNAQHHALLDAISAREGARAEALAREHARGAHENLRKALLSQKPMQRIPGANLIRRRGGP